MALKNAALCFLFLIAKCIFSLLSFAADIKSEPFKVGFEF